MQCIILQSHIGQDGQLQLNISTNLTNTESEVIIWLRPIETITSDKKESFSQWWAKQFVAIPSTTPYSTEEVRFDYLAERYQL